MLISLKWLSEYVDIFDITPEQIAHELTMSGLEVEEIEEIGAKFTNIVVAEIVDIKQHPNADKLNLVDVNNGSEIKTVVCGAQNIEKGQIIPYASVGSEVLDRKSGETFKLKPVKIRDVESQGMLCSADELGLVFRVIPHIIPSIKELSVPPIIETFTKFKNGLVLLTGQTGCGKSTTIASLLNSVNKKAQKHIVTLEDPIEFLYHNENSIFTQRQLGSDVKNYPEGVKYSLRQDPDIIVVGNAR